MAIKPLADKVLLKIEDSEMKSKGGIILPDTAKEKPQVGKVLAVGKGKLLDDGTSKPVGIKEGDKVLFSKYSGTEIKHEGDEFLLVGEDSILAVLTG